VFNYVVYYLSVFLTLDARKHDPPLSYLFQDDKLSLDSAAVIYKLHTNENIEYA